MSADKKKTLSLGGRKSPIGSDTDISVAPMSRGSNMHKSARGMQVEVVRKRQQTRRPGGSMPVAPLSGPNEEAVPNLDVFNEHSKASDNLTEAERAARNRVLADGLKKQPGQPDADISPMGDGDSQAEIIEKAPNVDNLAPIDSVPKTAFENQSGARQGAKRRETREQPKKPTVRRTEQDQRRRSKITITQALDGGDNMRQRSLASVRRAREREKARMRAAEALPKVKQIRDVIIPEVITVQELSNRMAERAADVIKELMKIGIMATVTQTIDAETAELVVVELGHKPNRVSEADVDIIVSDNQDDVGSLQPRPPVVTIMGHVDHGKTSILDAIRKTHVAAGESGGITQHIGAYQVKNETGNVITFIDTPGHEAFTEMRIRGANVTDIVVLVVAADDGVKPQTIEAINHASAAKCPIIVAINKCDKPEADADKVKNELLSHEIVTEGYGGEVLAVEVSAHTGAGLDRLEEAIMLQAELMELKANPDCDAEGAVIEAKIERGRGSVASLLVVRGTLKVGDIFVVGAEIGKVRALTDDRGKNVNEARPSDAVEVFGLNGTPMAGDRLSVVESEARAREVSDYRQRSKRSKEASLMGRGSVEQMLSAIATGEAQELPLVIKTDVHGSLEAIRSAIENAATDQVKVRILSSGVGAINESDVSLVAASSGMIIAFNVRANPQARNQAKRDNIEIRYHSIIYELIDEIKNAMSGLLAPDRKEEFIGYAMIKEVFNISKVGKIAGCQVTEGIIKRGCNVRLLRDNVVVHEGSLKTLKRFKDEVKEVREGQECGMAFENYNDIFEGDMIECFEIQEIARTID